MKSKIIQFGVPRSGSTLIAQILQDIFPTYKIWKVHGAVVGDDLPLVITYRDFRDCIASTWRTRVDIPLEDLDSRKMTLPEIRKEFKIISDRIKDLNFMVKKYSAHALILKYESFYNDFDLIFDSLEGFFNITIPPHRRESIERRFNMEANQKRANKIDSFHKWDSAGIHGLHIHKGKPGVWRDLVPEKHHISLTKWLKPSLDKWGYK